MAELGCERKPNQSSTSQCEYQLVESSRVGQAQKMVKLQIDRQICCINFNFLMANTIQILKQSSASRVEQLKNGRVQVGYADVKVFVHSLNLCMKIFTCKHASEFFHEHTIFFEVANNSKFDQLLFLIELLQKFLLLVQVWFV